MIYRCFGKILTIARYNLFLLGQTIDSSY